MNSVVARTVLATATISTARVGAGVFEAAILFSDRETAIVAVGVRGVETARDIHSEIVGYVSGANRSATRLPRAVREACDRAISA